MQKVHNKDFDSWNKVKKEIHNKESTIFCNKREIWWSSIGINIGSEEDGKNELFERPVLVLNVFNPNMLRVAPLTSQPRDDSHHVSINYSNRTGSVILSQIKTISTKRLSRKLCRLDTKQFNKVVDAVMQSLR
ncbi:MAG TPA: type II toxin-antitoxin system PemK/MazF family toxin [Candidatus Paceibacterota bacterium]